ncbi:MAG: DUF2752 domain-containing protein [Actinomycetota bacterium]
MSDRAAVVVRGSELRVPAAAMLAAGVALPLLGHPGPGCLLRALTDIPCPLCGMTTSVSSTVRGDLSQAVAAAPAGVAVVAFALWVLFTGRPRRLELPLPGVVLVLVMMWVFQLFRFSVL